MNNLPSLTYRFYISLLLLFAWAIPGCQSGVTRGNGQKGNVALLGKALLLPDTLAVIRNGQIVAEATGCVVDRAKATIVSSIWGDCHVCTEKLLKWEALLSNGKLSGANIVLIVATSNKAYFKKVLYPDLNSRQVLVIDEYHAISAMNSIPQGEQEYSTFLLDTSRRIQVVGDPLVFPKLMDLYEQIISKTNNHDN